MLKKIVVVCTGNICRSPIAEWLIKERAKDPELTVISAGTHALVGHPADPSSIEVMADHGYDIGSHRAQQATPALLDWADLIFALDQGHFDWLTQRSPHLRGRVFKLGKWQGNRDIQDPYQLPKAAFLRAYNDIFESVDAWLAKLGQLG
jgi:protein-tyrosine phosphatase